MLEQVIEDGIAQLFLSYELAVFLTHSSSPTSVGFDRNIYSGNPALEDLKNYSVKLSPEEQGKYFMTFAWGWKRLD